MIINKVINWANKPTDMEVWIEDSVDSDANTSVQHSGWHKTEGNKWVCKNSLYYTKGNELIDTATHTVYHEPHWPTYYPKPEDTVVHQPPSGQCDWASKPDDMEVWIEDSNVSPDSDLPYSGWHKSKNRRWVDVNGLHYPKGGEHEATATHTVYYPPKLKLKTKPKRDRLFSQRDSVEEALEYAMSLVPKEYHGVMIIACMVMHNTVVGLYDAED